jgi:hypothetical protein
MHCITIPALEIGAASSGNRGYAGRSGGNDVCQVNAD